MSFALERIRELRAGRRQPPREKPSIARPETLDEPSTPCVPQPPADTGYFLRLADYFADLAKSVEKSNPEAADAWRLDALRNLVWAGADVRVEDLPSDWRVEWEECAAVIEYDGGQPRERAEALAMTEILRRLRESGKIID